MAWNSWLLRYRAHVYRNTLARNSNGLVTGGSWAKVASSLPCYKKPLPSTLAVTLAGRLEGDNMFSMDSWDFEPGADIQAGDFLRNVTLDDNGETIDDFGQWWVVRGQQRNYASLGPLQLGRKQFLASRQDVGPYGCDPLQDLVGAWRFESSGTATQTDSSGRDNTLTLVGSASSETTYVKLGSRAGGFGGAGGYTLAHNDDLAQQAGRGLTVLAWAMLADTGAVRIIAAKWDGPSEEAGYALEYDSVGHRFRFSISEDGVAVKRAVANELGAPTVGAYYLVRGSYDPDAGAISVQVASESTLYDPDTTTGVTGLFNNSSTPFRIGMNADASPSYWIGYLDEVALYARAMSATEFEEHWNEGAGRAWPYI
jgi:hypothetical protein